MDQELYTGPDKQTKSFKPYLKARTNLGKELYERLVESFSKMEPHDRPWCAIGVTVDFIAVAPGGVTIAVIKEPSKKGKNLVHVPRNWREPWYTETVDREKHIIEGNPCGQGEHAVATIRHSIASFVKTSDRPVLPSIKCLILFPDGYDFEGPKEFAILDHEEVVMLRLRNLRDLSEAILMPTEQERLDSRIYRKWIEGTVCSCNDDSILGTWLDPAFDEVVTAPPKPPPLWRLDPSRHSQTPTRGNKLSLPDGSVQTRRVLKLTATIVAGMIVGVVGGGLYFHDVIRPMPQGLSSGRSAVPPHPEMPPRSEFTEVAVPQAGSLLPEDEKGSAPVPETVKSDDLHAPMLASENQRIESAKKLPVQSQTSDESQVEQQKMERLIRDAILLRAIKGVTVKFVDDAAYLEGQVATENQKSAAEKAARSVPGIKEVRNSIEVLQ